MLVNREAEFRKYLAQHPGRTIRLGKLPQDICVVMEDGSEIIVLPGFLLPE